jgi:hypothetical protein
MRETTETSLTEAPLYCPACQAFGAPVDLGDGVVQCRACRARLQTYTPAIKPAEEDEK